MFIEEKTMFLFIQKLCVFIFIPIFALMETEIEWNESRGRKRLYTFDGFGVGDVWQWKAKGKNVVNGKAKPSYAHKLYLSAMLWSKTRNLGWKIERRVDGRFVKLKRTA